MRRREFIAGLGSAAWPLMARAQQPTMPVIGFLSILTPDSSQRLVSAFGQGLRETGFIAGQNVVIEYRWAQNQGDRVPQLAADLIRRNVAAIVACCGPATVGSIKAATSKIPIIFETGGDPVSAGLVASLSRPGGNLTGVNSLISEVWRKSFDLMTKLLPAGRLFATLDGPGTSAETTREAQAAATAVGCKLLQFLAITPQEIGEAFASARRQGAEGLVIRVSALFYDRHDQLVALAARHAIPTIHPFRTSAESGGLMSYNIDLENSFRIMGGYTGRILKGERPADLPVQQATKFELIVNLKTAKMLGLTIPETLLATADEVIQ